MKEDLIIKLNQLLTVLKLIFCICIVYLFCHTDKLHDFNYKKIQSVESNGEETIKLMMLTKPQSQFFEDELKITATDTVTIKGK